MSRVTTYDAVSQLLGVAAYREPEMRRVMNRWLYNWAREGKITNYGTSKKALWDAQEVLDQYVRFVAPYSQGHVVRPEFGS